MNGLFWQDGDKNPGPPFISAEHPASKRYTRPKKLLQNPDAIVIGSGIGGLAMASLLAQKKKMRVLLLEGSSTPGGATRCHEVDGFEFNSGVDSIGDMDPRVGRGMYRPTADFITGGGLAWAKMPDIHEVSTLGPDETYNWYSSPDKNIEWVEKQFPGEGDVRKYYKLEEAVEAWGTTFAITKLIPNWVPKFIRTLFYRLFGGKWRKYMKRTSLDVFQGELGFSRHLAAVYSYMYGNHGATPKDAPFAFHAVNLLHYRDGAYYPVGGPAQVANCVIPIVEQAGGQLAVDSWVDKVLVEKGRAKGVRLESGEEIRCDLVISDASAYTTYMELLEPELRDSLGVATYFEEVGPSPGHVWLCLGYDEELDLPKQIYWQMPEYEGIDQYDIDTADIEYKKKFRFEGMGGYLLSPSARDPVYKERYPGKSTVIVLAEMPKAWLEKAEADPEWKAKVLPLLADNLEKVAYRHMPQLKGKTPSVRKYGFPMGCNPRAWGGCSLGLEPSGFRFVDATDWTKPETPIKGLWLTGQDAFSAGFSGAMLSARVTYARITGNWISMLVKKP